ncbi:MAG: hypothetical protein ABFD25_08845 [Clostridiaceae bacterium]
MRIRIYNAKIALLSSILVIVFFTAGCGKSGQQNNAQLQSAQQQQTHEKEPEKLKSIEKNLETLFETLGGPSVKMEEEGGKGGNTGQQSTKQQGTQQGSQQSTKQQSTQQGSQQSTKQQGTQQGSQQNTKQQGTQQGSQQGSQQGTKQQSTQQQGTKQKGPQQGTMQQGTKQQDMGRWPEIESLVSNLHYQWNDFMPEIAKKGADMKIVDNFDNALNTLTTTVASKNTKKALAAANSLYSHIPDLYSLYRLKMSPEVKRMVYYGRSIILEAQNDNWEQVIKDNKALEKSWSLFRNTLEKEQQQIGDKLNFSIYELDKVSSDKNKQLSDIKGRIVLSNIKELQKSFEEK